MRAFTAALLLVLFVTISPPVLAQSENVAGNEATSNSTAPPPTPTPPRQAAPDQEATEPNAAEGPQVLPESGQAIVKLFVLAALLESALALLFNWRPFVATLDGRAVKPLISFGVSLGVVLTFGLDDVEVLLEAYGSDPITGTGERVSQFIEAMIIAGGSSGVNTLLRNLGFRTIPTEAAPAKPPPTEAWISVALHRVRAVGPVQVVASPTGVLGTIHGSMGRRGFLGFFLRDKGRLPQSGGKSVAPGVQITVTVQGVDENNAPLPSPPAQTITPAPGALIDLEFTL
jgi:hypothetical protein